MRVRAGAVVCAVVASVPLVTGCGSDDSVVSAADATPTVTATPSAGASLSRERAQRQALVQSAKIDWSKAAETATGEVPQSELVELDLGRTPREASPSGTDGTASPSPAPTPGSPQWTATVALRDGTAHIVTIDAVTGEVRQSRAEQGQDTDDKRELAGLLSRATRTPQQAVDAATKKFPGTVTGLQLSEDDGDDDTSTTGPTVVWETEVADTDEWTEADIEVDAVTGNVLRERIDQD
ncbi:PepSY domain-containing protein [Streptomyces sp. NPDC000594]|uniref:PepSY domain-containing protein n=1 Tax=Streptomyces sp. NPDC000594 TaxID=3154261 RepID=UPI00332161EF